MGMAVAGVGDGETGTTVQTFCFWHGMQAVGRGPVGVVCVGGTSALGPRTIFTQPLSLYQDTRQLCSWAGQFQSVSLLGIDDRGGWREVCFFSFEIGGRKGRSIP